MDEKNASVPLTAGNAIKIASSQKQLAPARLANIEIRQYRQRWLVILIFIIYAATNMSQWIQYSIISNIISRYYGVSLMAVDWTSLVCMLVYVPLIFPSSYLMDRVGLRWTVLLGALITSAGSWVKVFSVSPDRFYLTLVGQIIIASAQITVLSVPGRLAANWFGPDSVSTATSIGLFGCQTGIAASFLVTPVIVKNHDDLTDIGNDLSLLFWGYAISSVVVVILVVLFLKDEPPWPPSETRALQKMYKRDKKGNFLESIKTLFENRSYLALCNSFGIIIGVLNAVSTLLNQMYLLHFKDGETEAGQIGLLIIITGMLGSVTFGIILDKTHKFKGTITAVYLLTMTGQVLFAISLLLEIKWMVYASAVIFGFFISGYFSLGYEVCAEFTYPINESTTTGILNLTNQVYGIILVLILDRVMERFGDLWAHLGITGVLVIGAIVTIFTKDLQKRQDVRRNANYTEIHAKEVVRCVS